MIGQIEKYRLDGWCLPSIWVPSHGSWLLTAGLAHCTVSVFKVFEESITFLVIIPV